MGSRPLRRRTAHLAVAAIAVAGLVVTLGALGGTGGAVGTLTPRGCIDDNDPPDGPDACGQTTNGLAEPDGVAVSRDGRSVYVVSGADDAIVRFNRADNGALTPRGCIDDNDTGPDNCGDDTNGLDGAGSVAISRDGKSVYVASDEEDDAIVRFNRADNGALTPRGCVEDNDPPDGPDNCGDDANGLAAVSAVAVSPDGESVYAASEADNAVVRFNRADNGALTPRGCIDDNDDGPDTCGDEVNGLGGAGAIAVSRDGRSVYVIGENDSAIVHFKRNRNNGALTPKGCIDDDEPAEGPDNCGDSTDGLSGASGVAVSPDGKSVYVAGSGNNAIVRFKRDRRTGALTPRGCIEDNDFGDDDCADATDGLDGDGSVVVSGDGRSVYATGEDDDSIVRFKRNRKTGALTPRGCIEDNDPPDGPDDCAAAANGLNVPEGLAVSEDGRSLYVSSEEDDAIVRFKRKR